MSQQQTELNQEKQFLDEIYSEVRQDADWYLAMDSQFDEIDCLYTECELVNNFS